MILKDFLSNLNIFYLINKFNNFNIDILQTRNFI